ncbi:MAG: signal peptidase I [Prolixibacteraceae bacterium]|nr:signal peptidase I [Prolixibacteraceae bacterium]
MNENNKHTEHDEKPLTERKKYIVLALFFLAAIFLFVSGMPWLGWVSLVAASLIFGYWLLQKRLKASKGRKVLSSVLMVLVVLVMAIFLRLFVFEVYEIPSESMENTLIPGDKILVNKLMIGPQTPQSPFEIPWVNLLFYLNKKARASIDSSWWKPYRLKGWSEIKRNDVLVFKNEPVGPDFFVKRCVALPGDEFQIKNSDIYINGNYAETNFLPGVKKKWAVYFNDESRWRALTDSLQLNVFQDYKPAEMKQTLILTRVETEKIKQFLAIDSLQPEIQPPDKDEWLSPFAKRGYWSPDQYGPIQIPYTGWTIDLNNETVNLYFETIRTWEEKIIETFEGRFFINGKEVTDYTFQNNYYVFMGDYRYNSVDSRMWGFLPEQEIVGKATRILWSNNALGIKWKRTLKRIK